MREQFRAENLNRRGRDDLVTIRQYGRESVVDFLFKFWEVCLKIHDLSEAEKLDRFMRALVPNVRVQVELRGPMNIQEAAMYAERADAILSRISGKILVRNGTNRMLAEIFSAQYKRNQQADHDPDLSLWR